MYINGLEQCFAHIKHLIIVFFIIVVNDLHRILYSHQNYVSDEFVIRRYNLKIISECSIITAIKDKKKETGRNFHMSSVFHFF